MRFVCDSCRAQYMISDEKVGPKGVKVRCKKCGYVILVRRANGESHAGSAPVEDEMDDRTQVMSNPMALVGGPPPPPQEDTDTNSGKSDSGALAGIEDDEIGAVFDQVLNSGTNPIVAAPATSEPTDAALGSEDDDRLRTRVLDADTMKKLTAESSGAAKNAADAKGKNGSAAPHDWFVAIDEKQTGPLTPEKIKDLWNSGKIGPDSLCWRAGFSDWMALSEVPELASMLAPRPAKPVIVAPAASPAVVTIPVESAFSAGGVTKTVRSEVPVALAGANPEETGSWKPSAASALASLVKEEIDVLSKPAPAAKAARPEVSSGAKGLLDIPSAEIPIPTNGGKPQVHETDATSLRGRAMPETGSFGPSYGSYRPPPASGGGTNKALVIGMSLGGVVVIGLLAAMLYILMSQKMGGGQQQTQPGAPVVRVSPPMPPPPAGTVPVAGKTAEPAKAASPVAKTEAPVAKAERPSGGSQSEAPRRKETRETSSGSSRQDDDDGDAIVARPSGPSKPLQEVGSSDDEFEKEFGGSGKSKKAAEPPKSETPKKNQSTVYVPPAPGSADIPESLGQSDVIQVVLGNKGSIVKCVNEQKAKDPDLAGRLVMRWTIQPSGRTSNISVRSEEFKSTHLATCIGGLIKSWTFPKHKVQGDPIDFPFTF